ncbi:hypothetical protein ANRL2_00930 [Anaerolineae bacterium]|nr:hypothetical protein ANRL2_00930 [Anaerolineae bacterium]
MAEYKPFLDRIFVDAEQIMWELSAKDGYFTNYAFLRRACQKHQGAYVELLKTVLDHRGETYVFNLAHQSIGSNLSSVAQNAGYEQDKDSGISEFNIWGDKEKAVVYRRTSRVQKPK